MAEADYDRGVLPTLNPQATGIVQSADGTRIAWYRYGQGARTILFVPTWNIVDARTVAYQVEALAEHATVITFDARGIGASDRPEHGYDFLRHAEDVVAVMDANRVRAASLITASRGINSAVLAVAQDPRRVASLAAIAPYVEFEPDPDWPDPNVLRAWQSDWPGFIRPFMEGVFPEPGSGEVIAEMTRIGLEATPSVAVAQEYECNWQHPAAQLAAVQCPTLLIHGDCDQFLPLADIARVVDALPNACLEIIPGGGHRPDIRSPELVNPFLTAFLND
jgi:pimeloyl-ACP methyl ester carboxylesterase